MTGQEIKPYYRLNRVSNLGISIRRCDEDPSIRCQQCNRTLDHAGVDPRRVCKPLKNFFYHVHGVEGAKEEAKDYLTRLNPGAYGTGQASIQDEFNTAEALYSSREPEVE